MKKIVSILLVGVLLLSALVPAFANESKTMNLTLEDALKLAEENSIVLKNYDANLTIAKRNLSSAQQKADTIVVESVWSDSEYLANGTAKDYTPAVKQRIVDDLIKDRAQTVHNIQVDVTSSYRDLQQKILSMENSKDNLEVQKTELESNKKKLDLGLVTKNTILDLENSIATSELNIKKSEWDLEKAYMDFAKKIGVDLNTKFNLLPLGDLSVNFSYDVEALAITAKEKGDAVLKAEKDLEMKKLQRDVENRYTRFKRPEGAEDFAKSITDLEKALEDAKIAAEVKVRSDYNSILNAKLDIDIAKLKVEIAERTLNTQQVKYDLGMVVYLEVTKAQNSLNSAKQAVQSAELSLYKLVENFDFYIKDFMANE